MHTLELPDELLNAERVNLPPQKQWLNVLINKFTLKEENRFEALDFYMNLYGREWKKIHTDIVNIGNNIEDLNALSSDLSSINNPTFSEQDKIDAFDCYLNLYKNELQKILDAKSINYNNLKELLTKYFLPKEYIPTELRDYFNTMYISFLDNATNCEKRKRNIAGDNLISKAHSSIYNFINQFKSYEEIQNLLNDDLMVNTQDVFSNFVSQFKSYEEGMNFVKDKGFSEEFMLSYKTAMEPMKKKETLERINLDLLSTIFNNNSSSSVNIDFLEIRGVNPDNFLQPEGIEGFFQNNANDSNQARKRSFTDEDGEEKSKILKR